MRCGAGRPAAEPRSGLRGSTDLRWSAALRDLAAFARAAACGAYRVQNVGGVGKGLGLLVSFWKRQGCKRQKGRWRRLGERQFGAVHPQTCLPVRSMFVSAKSLLRLSSVFWMLAMIQPQLMGQRRIAMLRSLVLLWKRSSFLTSSLCIRSRNGILTFFWKSTVIELNSVRFHQAPKLKGSLISVAYSSGCGCFMCWVLSVLCSVVCISYLKGENLKKTALFQHCFLICKAISWQTLNSRKLQKFKETGKGETGS